MCKGPCGLRNECAWRPSLAGGTSPENSEGAGPLCPPVGGAEHGSSPFCLSCTGSWWARVALGSCSRLEAGVEETEVSLNLCLRYENLGDPINRIGSFAGMRALVYAERLCDLGLGWGRGCLRIALSEPRVGVQDKTGIKEESRVPSPAPSDSSHTFRSGSAG